MLAHSNAVPLSVNQLTSRMFPACITTPIYPGSHECSFITLLVSCAQCLFVQTVSLPVLMSAKATGSRKTTSASHLGPTGESSCTRVCCTHASSLRAAWLISSYISGLDRLSTPVLHRTHGPCLRCRSHLCRFEPAGCPHSNSVLWLSAERQAGSDVHASGRFSTDCSTTVESGSSHAC